MSKWWTNKIIGWKKTLFYPLYVQHSWKLPPLTELLLWSIWNISLLTQWYNHLFSYIPFYWTWRKGNLVYFFSITLTVPVIGTILSIYWVHERMDEWMEEWKVDCMLVISLTFHYHHHHKISFNSFHSKLACVFCSKAFLVKQSIQESMTWKIVVYPSSTWILQIYGMLQPSTMYFLVSPCNSVHCLLFVGPACFCRTTLLS